jgi:hypothetical protein
MLRALLALVAVAQAALWWRVFAWASQLPERYPIHFDFAGKPDGWTTKRAVWFLLPAISLALLALFGGIIAWTGSLARSAPGIVNVPKKDLFVKLSPDGRAAVLAPTRVFLAWMLVLITALFIFIVEGSARVAVGQATTLPSWPVFVFLGCVFATLPAMMIATTRAIDRRAAEEGVSLSGAGARPAK